MVDSNSKTYACWRAMKQRCTCPKHKSFSDYGGRGIRVCDSWLHFKNFVADMGKKPNGLSLERIDNDKGYSPDNCKWATIQEQNINKRSNRFVFLNGEKLRVGQAEERIGYTQSAVTKILNRAGFSKTDIPALVAVNANSKWKRWKAVPIDRTGRA